MLRNNHIGFTVLEVILIIALVGLAAFAGWTWYQSQEGDRESVEIDETREQEHRDDQEPRDIPEGWTEYQNDELGFAFAYPQEWGEAEGDVNVEVPDEDRPHLELKEFRGSFEDSEVGFGITMARQNMRTHHEAGGRHGVISDYQGFEERNGQFFRVRYDEDVQRQVGNEPMDGYDEVEGANVTVLVNTSLDYFGQSYSHLIFNLDHDEFPAMNIQVRAEDPESSELTGVAETVRVF